MAPNFGGSEKHFLPLIGTLAGGIAHDLNNILTPIMMSIEMLKATSTHPRALTILDTIENITRRGADIVRQVLSFARGMKGDHVEVQPRHLLKDIQGLIKETLPKNIQLQYFFPHETWTIFGDPTQLHQILMNLCVNARDAMPDGGCLTIKAENAVIDQPCASMHMEATPGKYVAISVSDTGTGIPPEILDKIFEPFFTTKEIGKGTGRGLSTVIAIVKSHSGFLNAGQSNMQAWVVGANTNGLVASADIPTLRVFLVDVTSTDKPQQKFRQGTPGGINAPQRDKMTQYGLKWTPSTQTAAPWFSAVTYAFGRALQKETGVPTGLITDSLGGTVAEAWTPRDALESNPDLSSYLNDFHGAPTDAEAPGSLYNGAVAPLVPFALKGIVWYQGESNANSFEDAARYRTLFPALIGAWRKRWGEELPFLFVQLPAFGPMLPAPSDAPWAWLRESQLLTLQKTAATGMAVAIDTGSTTNLHPPTKLPIGGRLAQAALALVYQKPVDSSGPIYQAMTVQGDKIEVRFAHVGSGLKGKEVLDDDGKNHVPADPLRGFAICGADQKFVWAEAKITGKDTVTVSSPQVSSPQAVRYAWAAFPACNLYSVEGLPASPFRTDDYQLPQP